MTAVVLALPENDRLTNRIGAFLDLDVSSVVVHRFPDGEARVRLNRSVDTVRAGTWWAAKSK